MKSVDALRKWADGLSGIWIDPNDHSIIVTTCDDMPPSIDCVSLRDHVNAILDGIEREVVDMVPLPVDADGVPIHVGDVMDEGKVAKVVLTDEHWEPSVYVYKLPNVQHEYFCSEVTHHHAPTVEDVLAEMLDAWGELPSNVTNEAIVAEYAAKLRLAEDNYGLYEWERDE